MRSAIASFLAVAALSACDPYGFNKPLPNCGKEESTGFSGTTYQPAQDEGNGRVSFVDETWNDTGGYGYDFNLLKCDNGLFITVGSYGQLGGEDDRQTPERLTRLVEETRQKTGFVDPLPFWRQLERLGYHPQAGRAYTDYKRAVCSCRTFYPEIKRDWPVKSAKQKAEEKAAMVKLEADLKAILAKVLEEPNAEGASE